MTLLNESTPKTGLSLDKRQRAMLKEMGVQVWQPLAKTLPQPAVMPTAAPAQKAPLSAIDSEAARPETQAAPRTIDTQKQVFQAPKEVAPAPRAPSNASSTTSGTTSGTSAWRIGKLQTLYAPQSVASAARWLVLIESPARALQERSRRLKFRRSRDDKLESTTSSSPNPGTRHIAVPIANECHAQAIKRSACLPDRKKIRQNLAGMFLVGEGINGRDATESSKILHIFLRKGSDHSSMDHAAQHAGRVTDWFPPPKLDIGGGQEKCIAAEFADADFKRYTGACG